MPRQPSLPCIAPRSYLFTSRRSSIQPLQISIQPQSRRQSTIDSPSSSSKSPSPKSQQQSFNPFGSLRSGPSPPRLPKEDQDIFEALQRQSTGAFSTPRAPPQINQSPDATAGDVRKAEGVIASRVERLSGDPMVARAERSADTQTSTQSEALAREQFERVIEAKGKGEELHPNIRRGAVPEFEGDTNPKTGEVGGPKNEPLRWGPAGEWSYNGRTTDF